jgi:hypothetical protein
MTSTDWIRIAIAAPGAIAAVIGYLNARTIKTVHILVNSKMTEALETIASLRVDKAASALTEAARAAADVEAAKIVAATPVQPDIPVV